MRPSSAVALYVIDATLGPLLAFPLTVTFTGLLLFQPVPLGVGVTAALAVITATPVPLSGNVSTELDSASQLDVPGVTA